MNALYSLWSYLPLKEFVNPEKRIYWPYLAICILYAIIYIIFSKTKIKKPGIQYWFHPSAKIDYAIWVLNNFLQILLFPFIFVSGLSLSTRVYYYLINVFGPPDFDKPISAWVIVWYSIVFLVISDFSRYMLHYLMHHSHLFWSIHRLHHTAEVLTPITLFRVHPLEMILFQLRYLVVYAIVTGVFLYVYADIFEFPKLFGASFIVFISNALGANLRHSHIPIGFGVFEHLFISPKQHQIHHSKEVEMQKSNMGSLLAIWDIIFSTWIASKSKREIQFGLKNQKKQSFKDEIVFPIKALRLFLKKRKVSKRIKSNNDIQLF